MVARHTAPRATLRHSWALACAVIGGPTTVAAGLAAFQARTGADEIIATASIFDHAARVRSFEVTARAFEAGALAA